MAHENKTHIWPSWCTNPVIDPTGAYRTRDGQCQWCGGTHYGSRVCPYSPAYKEPEIKAPVAHEKGTEIPNEWALETMRMINALTPDIKEKAFNPDWFLLRARLEVGGERIAALTLDNERLRAAIGEMIDERFSEFDMMSCEYLRGSSEAVAWESAVRQTWTLWELSKRPGIKALALKGAPHE